MHSGKKLYIASLAGAAPQLLRNVRVDRIQAEREVLQEILQVHLILIRPDGTGGIDQYASGFHRILCDRQDPSLDPHKFLLPGRVHPIPDILFAPDHAQAGTGNITQYDVCPVERVLVKYSSVLKRRNHIDDSQPFDILLHQGDLVFTLVPGFL